MVRHCVLGPDVRVNSYAQVESSIILEGATIGRHARIRRAIIEKGVVIPDHAVIGFDPVEDARLHRVTEGGIVVVDNAPARHAPHMAPAWPAKV
jgi:glucose-1-phosphate adenylyltransferase